MNIRGRINRYLALTGVLLFFLVLYFPIVIIVVYSFNANVVNMMTWDGFTLDWYKTIFGQSTRLDEASLFLDSTEQILSAVKTSLKAALIASLISTVFGTAIALAVARFRFRLAGFYRVLMGLPMMTPDIVLGIALLIYFIAVGIDLGLTSIVIGHCTFLISYVFVTVSARLAGMDSQLEEAAHDLGANPFQTFRRVTLPLIAPGVVGGAILGFIISMDDVVITYFISGAGSTTLPVFIFGMLRRGITPEINAIATLLLVFTIVIATLGVALRAKKH